MRLLLHVPLAFILGATQGQPAPGQVQSSPQPVIYAGEPNSLAVSLSADRSEHYVGEAVHLVLEIRNETPGTTIGIFTGSERMEKQYRRPGASSFTELRTTPTRRAIVDRWFVGSLLEPGETARREITLAAQGTGGLVLDAPGEYQFRILCRPARDRPEHVLSSNVVSVQVDPAPAAHQEALAVYVAEGLPAFVQNPSTTMEARPPVLEKALGFLDKYPHSPYVEPLRKAALDAVRYRVLGGKATEREREIYEKLDPAESRGDPLQGRPR
jgi:hypothetical protein